MNDVPFGYQLAADGVALVPNESEQEVMQAARELQAGGMSRREIAAELVQRGIMGAPYGYRLAANGKLEADEAEQRVVRAVRAGRAAGLSYAAIAAELARAGYLPKDPEPPYGYRRNGGGGVVKDAAEQRALRLIDKLRADGLSMNEIMAAVRA